jgi:hypothetical protein
VKKIVCSENKESIKKRNITSPLRPGNTIFPALKRVLL